MIMPPKTIIPIVYDNIQGHHHKNWVYGHFKTLPNIQNPSLYFLFFYLHYLGCETGIPLIIRQIHFNTTLEL